MTRTRKPNPQTLAKLQADLASVPPLPGLSLQPDARFRLMRHTPHGTLLFVHSDLDEVVGVAWIAEHEGPLAAARAGATLIQTQVPA